MPYKIEYISEKILITGELPQGLKISSGKIIVEKDVEVDLVEHFNSDIDLENEIIINENAIFNHYRLYEEGTHNISTNVSVMKNSSYNAFCLQKTKEKINNNIKVLLREENAKTNINIAYLAKEKAVVYNNTLVEHLVPYTFSSQLIKAVIRDSAKGDFTGKIHIAKDAVKSEGGQLHKALLLSDTAEVKCLPELEIFADDVKCSHGAATGVLDEMQLFYMCSRGINLNDAKQMLIDAYLDDVFSKIGNNEIYMWIKDRIK